MAKVLKGLKTDSDKSWDVSQEKTVSTVREVDHNDQ